MAEHRSYVLWQHHGYTLWLSNQTSRSSNLFSSRPGKRRYIEVAAIGFLRKIFASEITSYHESTSRIRRSSAIFIFYIEIMYIETRKHYMLKAGTAMVILFRRASKLVWESSESSLLGELVAKKGKYPTCEFVTLPTISY